MSPDPTNSIEDLRAECAALRSRLSEAEDRLARVHDRGREDPVDPTADIGRLLRQSPGHGTRHQPDGVDRALAQAREAASALMESARTAHAKAEVMKQRLQVEIRHRQAAEDALAATERRYRRLQERLGRV